MITLAIPQFCLLFILFLLGMLMGMFITLCFFKLLKEPPHTLKHPTRKNNQNTTSVPVKTVVERSDSDVDTEKIEDETNGDTQPHKFSEGSVLKEKLDREGAEQKYAFNCSVEGVDPNELMRRNQEKVDRQSFSILQLQHPQKGA